MATEEVNTLLDLVRSGELEQLKVILSTDEGVQTLLTEKDEFTQATSLHMAAANGHDEVLKLLLSKIPEDQRKQFVNSPNYTGNTALHWTALTGSLNCAKLLCEAGADPLLQNSNGIDSCYQADSSQQEDVATYLYSLVDVPEGDEEDLPEDESTTNDTNN